MNYLIIHTISSMIFACLKRKERRINDMIKLNDLHKVYTARGGVNCRALNNINLQINDDEFLAIMGESGSGKSTILNMISMIDSPTSGNIVFDETNNSKNMTENQKEEYRSKNIGMIFQDFKLLNKFSLKDNILMPLLMQGFKYESIEPEFVKIVEMLNLDFSLDKYPYEISGGQQQRIAIARALIKKPDIILADEPTGALDSKNSELILKLLKDINKTGQTILMVTHSVKAASFADRIIILKDGSIDNEIRNESKSPEEIMRNVTDYFCF